MDILKKAILRLSKEEARAFKLFAQKVTTKAERKDLELFDIIRKSGENYDDDEAYGALYPGRSRNNLHRLKSRLLKELNKSQLLLRLDNDDTLKVYHLLSVSRLYHQENEYDLAYHYLNKAERLAKKLNDYRLLDLVYDEIISLSQEVILINPEPYFKKRRDNQDRLRRLRKLEDVLSVVNYRIRKSQSLGARRDRILEVLEEALQQLGSSEAEVEDPAFRIRVFQLVSRLLLQQEDFYALEHYASETYQNFEKDGIFNRNTHGTKLQILSFIVNSLFKIGEYERSLDFIRTLWEAMQEYDGMLKERYLLFYYNSLVINYSQTDPHEAIRVLEEMLANRSVQQSSYNLVFLHLNLLGFYYSVDKYKEAIRQLIRTTLLDSWAATGQSVRLRVAVYEMMIRYRLKDYENLLQRIPQIRQDFEEQLDKPAFSPERRMLDAIELLRDHLNLGLSEEAREEIRSVLEMDLGNPENQVIEYRTFLESLLGS